MLMCNIAHIVVLLQWKGGEFPLAVLDSTGGWESGRGWNGGVLGLGKDGSQAGLWVVQPEAGCVTRIQHSDHIITPSQMIWISTRLLSSAPLIYVAQI